MEKISYLTALRGWAVLGVIIVHVGLWTSGLPEWFDKLTHSGQYGVQLFFILSSFTLFMSMSKRKEKGDSDLNFFIRRFFRIAPLFYLALIVYTVVNLLLVKIGMEEESVLSIGNIIGTLVFIGNGFNPYWINNLVPGGWSITVEMTFYLLVPYLFLKIKNIKSALLLALGTTLVGFLITYLMSNISVIKDESTWLNFLYYWFPNQMPIFCLGILVFHIQKSGKLNKIKHKTETSTFLLCISVPMLYLLPFYEGSLVPIHFLYALLFLILIIALDLNSNKIIDNKVTMYLGEISFSMYLTQFLAIDIVRFFLRLTNLEATLNNNLFFVVLFGLSLILTVCFSFITYNFIEKPGNKLGNILIEKINSKKFHNAKEVV